MQSSSKLPRLRDAVMLAIGLFGIGAAIVENPAVVRAATNFISNTCSTATTCYQWTNTGTGAAIRGASNGASGIVGATSFVSTGSGNWKAGVYGNDVSTSGVYDRGVYGLTANGYGVYGAATASEGVGVQGTSTDSTAVGAVAFGSGNAVAGLATGGGTAVVGQANTGEAGYFSTGGVSAVPAIYGYASASGTVGADVTGQYEGLVARAPSGEFPLVVTDTASPNALFWVDASGNVYYHGTLNQFVRTPGDRTARVYSSSTTSPAIEDTGTARLVNGSAVVMLDSTFAATMDPRSVYQVMLTPDGDTRGLYVETKSARYFVVREVQGGHGMLNFDYHIYGASFGTAGVRAAFVNEAAMEPHAPLVHRLTPRVK